MRGNRGDVVSIVNAKAVQFDGLKESSRFIMVKMALYVQIKCYTLMGQLQVLQNKAAKVLLNLPPRSSSAEALDRLDLKPLLKRRHFHRCIMMQKYLLGEIDFKFDVRRNSSFHSYLTRRSNDLHLPRVRTNRGKQTFIYQASKDWNSLDNDFKNIKSLSLFKAKLKKL